MWFDDFVLRVGMSLRRSIDKGLAGSRFGVVALSPAFFGKEWPERELDGLAARETTDGQHLILPVWHDVDKQDVVAYSPVLADVSPLARKMVSMPSSLRSLTRSVRRIALANPRPASAGFLT